MAAKGKKPVDVKGYSVKPHSRKKRKTTKTATKKRATAKKITPLKNGAKRTFNGKKQIYLKSAMSGRGRWVNV